MIKTEMTKDHGRQLKVCGPVPRLAARVTARTHKIMLLLFSNYGTQTQKWMELDKVKI